MISLLPQWLSSKESTCNVGDAVLIPGSGRSLGDGNGNPFQYSCLENLMDKEACQVIQSMRSQLMHHNYHIYLCVCVCVCMCMWTESLCSIPETNTFQINYTSFKKKRQILFLNFNLKIKKSHILSEVFLSEDYNSALPSCTQVLLSLPALFFSLVCFPSNILCISFLCLVNFFSPLPECKLHGT